jgi:transposase
MARTSGVTISVKIPIKWDAMTRRKQQRLRQTVGRDTRVIRAFLGIIEQYEDKLLTGRNRKRIHEGRLDELTMTALKVKAGSGQRLTVPHDFKARFPRISTNELGECRKTAVAQYESYIALRAKKNRKASRPCEINSTRRIPRWVFSQRFQLIEKQTKATRWWLDLRDSFDSKYYGRRIHDRLLIPLKMSPFHLNQLSKGEIKALQIFSDRYQKWWVTIAVRINLPKSPQPSLPPAILGIDLGIEKAACTTLVTPKKISETRYFIQKDKVVRLKKYDEIVSTLQYKMNFSRNQGLPHDGLAMKLKQIRAKRENVAKEYDRFLIRQLKDYISELSTRHDLYVTIGRLKNIRNTARRGNLKGRKFRGMIHSWAFSRITESLKHQLAQLGWTVEGKTSRFHIVPETWTSIICWKCGKKGYRPKQTLFVCSCGFKTNADRNGSLNIARRLIKLIPSLRNDKGLGRWAFPEKAPAPKAERKKLSSEQKPTLSFKGQLSDLGESAAVHHVQKELLCFGDDSEMGDNDPAVVRTMEVLTVAESDKPATRQEKKARSVGGKVLR